MGRIVAHTFSTLDGVIETTAAEAYQPYIDDAAMQETISLVSEMDALLLGRKTYEGLAGLWKDQSGPVADRLNAMPKYVLSRTLDSADAWDNATIVGYDDVAGLRERLDLVSYGCGRLARDLLRDDLLDELQLWFAPVVVGSGPRLFGAPDALLTLGLELAESRAFDTGAVRLTYTAPSA